MWKPGDVIAGLVFLAIGVVFVIGAVMLQVGVPTEPRPGFFPFIDGTLLILLSLLYLFQAFRGGAGESESFGKVGRPALVVLSLVLYVATLETLGYVITTAVLSAVVLKVMQTKPWFIVLVSLILSVVSYLLFDRLLGVTLPAGLLASIP